MTVKNPEGYTIGYYHPETLKPPHPPHHPEKVRDLELAMRIWGWVGRPLIISSGRKTQCLTGSHRLEAAKRIPMPVPTVRLEEISPDLEDIDLDYILKHPWTALAEYVDEDEWGL